MDKDAVLAFAKKNVISLICAVVALLAVAATFYPLGDMQSTLQQQSDEKAHLSDTLGAFLKERKRPVNSLETTDYGRLDGLPNAATIKLGKEAAQVWKDYGTKTIAELIDMNKSAHPLMQTDELPVFNLDSDSFKFPQLYLAVLSVDPAVSGVAVKDAKPSPESKLLIDNNDLNLQNNVLHGGKPPAQADEDAAEKALWNDKYEVRIVEQNGKRVNEPDLLVEYNAEKKDLPLKLKKDLAKKYKCYVDPTAFNVYNPIATDPHRAPAPDEVWYCQTQVWVDRDLCEAVAQMNSSSTNVLDAPVKRVLSVNNVEFTSMYVKKPAATGAPGQPTPPVVPGGAGAESAPIVPDYTVSPTGRYCNPMYDVVKFNLCVDVDASKVNEFIETLSRNNFMTVTSESDFAVDTLAEFERGYLYGNVPVVRLQLTGESLFFRGWTAPGNPTNVPGGPQDLMPIKIKEQLGILAPSTGGPAMPGMPNQGSMPGQRGGPMRSPGGM